MNPKMRDRFLLTLIVLFTIVEIATGACPAGFYSSGGCKPCTPGNNNRYSCSSGTYCLGGSSSQTACPASFYCPSKTSLPIKCPEGTYSGGSATSCTNCQAGYYCLNGVRYSCPNTKHQTSTRQQYCHTCSLNHYCNGRYQYGCSNYYYSAPASTSCSSFNSNHYRPTTSQYVRQCPNGYYQDSYRTTCTLCPAGKYCGNGDTSISWCPNYQVSPGGLSGGCFGTPSGMVSSNANRLVTDLTICSTGYYRYNVATCYQCTAGYYCPDPTSSSHPNCPAGKYTSGNRMMFCYDCPPNYRCTGYNNKDHIGAGYYYTTPYVYYAGCPAGSWCPNTYIILPCPPGYYSGSRWGSCTAATSGYISYGTGRSLCSAYQYSYNAETSCRNPPPGYSVNGQRAYSHMNYCPPGTYSNTATQCYDCGGGKYCPNGWTRYTCPASFDCPGTRNWPRLCHAGTYCVAGENSRLGCSSSTYSLYGSSGCTSRSLNEGYYQYAQTSYLKAVAPGKYLSSWNEYNCGTDRYCIYGVYKSCPTGLSNRFLPAGNVICTPCEYGKACYGNTAVTCYNSSRTSQPGNTDCFQCNQDEDCVYRNQYFLLRNTDADQHICQRGLYSNIGDLVCSEIKVFNNHCPFGYYQDIDPADVDLHPAEKKVLCKQYGLFGGANLPVDPTIGLCQIGTYTISTFDACVAAPPGYLTPKNDPIVYNEDSLCPQGFYCSVAYDHSASLHSLSTQRCPYGTYARDSFTGGKAEGETCLLCPPGYYCPGDSLKHPCPTSYICDVGTTWPIVTCPEGFYYDTTKPDITTFPRCVQCPLGKFCPHLSTEATIEDCPEGYTCGAGSFIGTTAPANPGYYIPEGGTETICGAGNYCPVGSIQEYPCPVLYSS